MGIRTLDKDSCLCRSVLSLYHCKMGAESTLGCWSRVGAALKCSFFSCSTFPSIFKRCDKVAWGNGSTYSSRFLVFLIEKENTSIFIWFYRYFLFCRTRIKYCRLRREKASSVIARLRCIINAETLWVWGAKLKYSCDCSQLLCWPEICWMTLLQFH